MLYSNFSNSLEQGVLHIFMEYIPGGSISSRLGSTGAFSEEETKRCMRQILEGLLFLHNRMIIHRDVKGQYYFCNIHTSKESIIFSYISTW